MSREIHRRLQEIERDYYDNATYEALCENIVESAALISSLDEDNALREVCEVFAPQLWGSAAGSAIEPKAVLAALSGPDGDTHLRSWSGIGRVLLAYRAVA